VTIDVDAVARALGNCGGCGDGVNWDQAAKQAEREMPQAPLEDKEERALAIMETTAAAVPEVEPSIYTQGPQGNNVLNHYQVGRQMMQRAGQNPDKPLDINFNNYPDRRDNRDPQTVGLEHLSRSNGSTS
jgi:hypothetical protein